MARLSKHGKELLRIEKETDITDLAENITWRRVTRAYMADGKVLQKIDVRWKPDQYRPTGEFYSFGWKVDGKAKPGIDMKDIVARHLERAKDPTTAASKWQVISSDVPPPVILDTTRIMEAIESGDNIGFCKACGAEHDGCEPDARGYKCEECGQMEVYGAEECLIGA
jgi:hypothetical protein